MLIKYLQKNKYIYCIIYSRISIPNAGKDIFRSFENWFDKHIITHIQMHILFYGCSSLKFLPEISKWKQKMC